MSSGRGAAPVRAALFGNTGSAGETIQQVYGQERLDYLRRETCLFPEVVTSGTIDRCLEELCELEAIFCTWGMFPLTGAQLDGLPNLRAVFYAAGSVRHFAEPLLDRGITVVSGWAANAVPVAEFTLGQIVLAGKGYFRNVRDYTGPDSHANAFRGHGNFERTVAVLGAGQIGRLLIALLRPFHLRVVVFDPFLSHKNAEALGVEKVSLEEAFVLGNVVSNHLADVPGTKRLLNGRLFATLPPNATFINTGRGATVGQDELIRVLRTRPDLTALLDVTDPEPLPADSPLFRMPNVQVTSHIAGAIGGEVGRIAETVIEEFDAWRVGRPLRYSVTSLMLQTMA